MCLVTDTRAALYKTGIFVHSQEQICEFILRKLLLAPLEYTLSLGQIRWWLYELMCYCFLIASVWRMSVRHYQSMETLLPFRFPLASPWFCFPFFSSGGWWHLHKKLRLISTRGERRATERFPSDLTCFADLFSNCNQTLCSEMSCDLNTVFFSRLGFIIISLFSIFV